MRHTLLYMACVLLSVLPAVAQDDVRAYTVEDVPNVRLADTRRHVSDPSAILSTAARDTIDAIFTRLESETGIEACVVMLPSIGDDDPFDFSHRLFRHWGVGKKNRDNGLVILFVADRRTIRFTTGYGLEGALPDAACKRIQTRYMLPAFRQGNWDAGMTAGAKAVYTELKDSMKPDAADDSTDMVGALLFMAFAIVFVIVVPIVLNRLTRKCPHCGKSALRKMSSDVFKDKGGNMIRKDVYVCNACGRITVKHTHINDNNNDTTGSLLNGMIIGSMLGRHGRGGFGGGGFSGGSFGGGDSGGGGADSSW